MAHWNGGSDTRDDGMILQTQQIPDTVEHVTEQTESVARNFFCESYRQEMSANVDASNRQLANEDSDSNSTSISDLFNPDTTRYNGYWEGKT